MNHEYLNLPKHAQVIVIGGGIIGTSCAYHLAEIGFKDVVLLERDRLTSGTTWHAAGLMVTFGSTSHTSTELRKYTRDFYLRIQKETGLDTGFRPIGFIELACSEDRLEEFRRVAEFNRYLGVDVHEISAHEVKKLFPLARVDDVLAGFYVKEDGRVNPVDVTMAISKAAKMKGVKIFEGVQVTGLLKSKTGTGATTLPTVQGVKTNFGEIHAEIVLNCAGMWARTLGEKEGIVIPNQSAEHYYLITEDIEDLPQNMPVLEDPDSYGYYRQEMGGLMIGLFEPKAKAWCLDKIPEDFSFGEIEPDWDRMGEFLEKAMSRVPITQKLGIRKFFCGPESFTPDLKPILGEAPELKNYFVAAGLNSIGILTGGGIGRLMAHWIKHGVSDLDITGMHVDRFHAYQMNKEYRKERTTESLGLVYRCHYPYMSLKTARDAKKSVFYDRLKSLGAYFKEVSGWESPDWFLEEGSHFDFNFKNSFKREPWFKFWEQEHKAARSNVVLMDMSFMSKFLVQGKDAGKFLNWLSTNNVDGESERITYTQWLNEKGTLEADLTVSKLNEESFLVIVTDTMHRHALTWMKKHLSEKNFHAFVFDATSSYSQLNIQGPRSRELLQKLTSVNLSNEAFPYRTIKEIDLGLARLYCARITYLGELGFELYIPTEFSLHVFDRIVEEGKKFNLRFAGLKALSSLHLEKGYRDYGHDLDNTDDPFEVGLSFCLNLNKEIEFIGKKALEEKYKKLGLKNKKQIEASLLKRLCQVLVLDPQPLLYHAEVIYRNKIPVGYLRSGSYGHTLKGAVGLAMIEKKDCALSWDDYLLEGNFEVKIADRFYPCSLQLKPLYDPENLKIKS